MLKKYDYIIVGQGLAGTVLAHTMIIHGHSVLVIDSDDPASASKVAAGIYNPIVPKRLAKSWKIDELLPALNIFYPQMEARLGVRFFHHKRMIKPFSQEQEKVQWTKKCAEDVGAHFLSKVFIDDDFGGTISNPVGAGEILQTGNVDMRVFLSASRAGFKKQACLLEEQFDHSKLRIETGVVSYKEYSAGKLIFCEGFRFAENPWFGKADHRLTKGEILLIKLVQGARISEEFIINKGVFVLPLGHDIYKVGATFNWDDRSQVPTEKARQELIEKLDKVLKVPYEIIDQQAGIRPTMNDRRPVIGLHPGHPVLGIFNGLGTKGVMLAPYFAEQFVAFLEDRSPIDPEVDFARF